jgi:chromosomal replication initiator protein
MRLGQVIQILSLANTQNGVFVVSGTFSIPLGDAPLRDRPTASSASAYALREFIAGDENRLVRVLLPALDRPHFTGPLFLYGPTGCGKSLLALALARQIRELHPGAKTLHTSGADFARAYADALDANGLADFRKRFMQAAFVLLDDIHQLATKPSAQEEWRRMLDLFAQRGTPVVIVCRCAPGELAEFDADLRGRLSAGLVVPLYWPGRDARREMIQSYLAIRQARLGEDEINRLANEIDGPPARLFATLAHLLHLAATDHRSLDAALVAEVLAEYAASRELAPRVILAAVAKMFQLKSSDLKGPSRRQTVSTARGVAMLLLRELRHASYHEIGQQFNGRDHSTVMHACEKTRERLATDGQLAERVADLKFQLMENP